ncbi:MAG: response regulator [Candidatus Omnitrophica bacterium]|nr:response regulator [Candidatus Omnitrophota bacterium]MCA9434544.1 response regulator [Candidatus Omnitrophota bacterium]MCA9441221.1 response regulator [Candidatus Omnitrophota bacterium]MCA9445476.1 response regulator [Candidatus Omnitrophota bacterium]MCB9769314.1 response regulator [Candidatus Omnitrophota bacterium]
MDKSKNLLIIEDDPDLRMTLEYFLGKIGYQVLAAKNCESGLKILREQHPRAVICDIMLPGMDGYEACRTIKEDPSTEGTAVIFISARDGAEIERKGAEVGADFYISKPVDPSDVGADLYFLFDQDFHLTPENARKLRVTKRIPAKSASPVQHEMPHTDVMGGFSTGEGFEDEFEDDLGGAPPQSTPVGAPRAPGADGPHSENLSPEAMSNMNLSEVHQLLVSLRDSLKDTGQRLDAILQYIEVIEE